MIELAARRLSRVRWSRYARISAGPRMSGDLRKWQANRTTCDTYTRCVFAVRLRICMSSIMRRRSGLIDNSFARRTAPHGAGASSRYGIVRPDRRGGRLPQTNPVRLENEERFSLGGAAYEPSRGGTQ